MRLRHARDCSVRHQTDAANLLHSQWPKLSVNQYLEKIQTGDSYLLLFEEKEGDTTTDTTTQVVGHGRLIPLDHLQSVAVSYVIVRPQGKGHGRLLMEWMESKMISSAYHYCYLWTATAVPFYQKLGYKVTHKVSLMNPCLKKLQETQISNLENMLARRHPCIKPQETVLLPDEGSGDSDVWMRKRLVENLDVITIPESERRHQLHDHCILHWLNVPHQTQVGPTCGIVALHMVLAYYQLPPPRDSLLQYAIKHRYSEDGELFDIQHLEELAIVCGLSSSSAAMVAPFPSLQEMQRHLQQSECVILAYDSQPVTYRPVLNGGKNAHYGIVVGLLRATTDDEILLAIQHGLSSQLTIATYHEFHASNQQLWDVDSSKYANQSMKLSDCALIIRPP